MERWIMFWLSLLFIAAGASVIGIYAESVLLGGGVFLVGTGLTLGTGQW